MSLTATQKKNCDKAIDFMLNKVKPVDFVGSRFDFTLNESRGCLMYHMVKARCAPKAIRSVVTERKFVSSEFVNPDSELYGLIEAYYGAGSGELFGTFASVCGTDYKKFFDALNKHAGSVTEVVTNPVTLLPKASTANVHYVVESNNVKSEFANIDAATADARVLRKYGFHATITKHSVEVIK